MRSMENKQEICDRLLPALQKTRALNDLKDLDYHVYPEEEVLAVFRDGYCRKINVACDSGLAMISDIIRGLK